VEHGDVTVPKALSSRQSRRIGKREQIAKPTVVVTLTDIQGKAQELNSLRQYVIPI
jgi:hypothetical protein